MKGFDMTKIVYNACYGGFGLSPAAMNRYKEIKGLSSDQDIYDYEIDRTDPVLIQVIEELGDKANDTFSKLRIIDLPEGTMYRIDEYDGREKVMTQDNYEWSIA
jgi:hypothetical protein